MAYISLYMDYPTYDSWGPHISVVVPHQGATKTLLFHQLFQSRTILNRVLFVVGKGNSDLHVEKASLRGLESGLSRRAIKSAIFKDDLTVI